MPQRHLAAGAILLLLLCTATRAFQLLPPTTPTSTRIRALHPYASPRRAPTPLPLRRPCSVALQSPDSNAQDPSASAAAATAAFKKAKQQAIPSLATLLRFTIPTLGIWLAGPIMSLVDTSVVGLSSDLELAGMGPATNLCDSFLYVFTFLAVATTNLLAGALADGDEEKSQRVVSHALAIALAAGIGVMLLIEVFGTRMLQATVGADGPLLIPVSLKYTSIRALGAPFVLMSMVAQAALLGAKDSVTPLVVTLAAGLINFVLDVGLVSFGKLGISGAAAATVTAEVVGTTVLLRALKRSQGPNRLYPFISLSSFKDVTKFFSFAGPVFFALFGKTVCYTSLGVAAQMMGTVPLAAHQVMLRVFFFFTTFGDSLSTTAQAFLPGFLVNNNRLAIGKVVRRLVIISVGVGGLNAAAAGLIPAIFPGLFTTNAEIILEMQALAPWLSGSLLAHACTMALEGILLAERELSYLASSYALNTLLVVGGLWALRHVGGGIQGVWGCLLFFQVSRLTFFATRLLLKHGLMKKGWRKVKHALVARGWLGRKEDDGRIGGGEGAAGAAAR